MTLWSPSRLLSLDCSTGKVNKERPLKCWGIKRHGFTRHKTSSFCNAAVILHIYHKVLTLLIACTDLRLALFSNLAVWSAFSLSGDHWTSPCPHLEGIQAEYASNFNQECANLGCLVAVGTKFYKEAPEVCGTPEWNLVHVTFLVPKSFFFGGGGFLENLIFDLGNRWKWVVSLTFLPLYPRERTVVSAE